MKEKKHVPISAHLYNVHRTKVRVGRGLRHPVMDMSDPNGYYYMSPATLHTHTHCTLLHRINTWLICRKGLFTEKATEKSMTFYCVNNDKICDNFNGFFLYDCAQLPYLPHLHIILLANYDT